MTGVRTPPGAVPEVGRNLSPVMSCSPRDATPAFPSGIGVQGMNAAANPSPRGFITNPSGVTTTSSGTVST